MIFAFDFYKPSFIAFDSTICLSSAFSQPREMKTDQLFYMLRNSIASIVLPYFFYLKNFLKNFIKNNKK